jgi:hypothetical protein
MNLLVYNFLRTNKGVISVKYLVVLLLLATVSCADGDKNTEPVNQNNSRYDEHTNQYGYINFTLTTPAMYCEGRIGQPRPTCFWRLR